MKRLSLAFDEQYDVGFILLGSSDNDPADLRWMSQVGVRAGCLGLWDGEPADGRLVIAGVHGADGRLHRNVGAHCTVEEFPPRDVLDLADARIGEVAYVIPVRNASGDHGLLCILGAAEPDFAHPLSVHDHWAALLGASLREKRMLEDVRHSEERYAVAARAAKDGLWEWSLRTGDLYLSDRCRELIGIEADVVVKARSTPTWVHPDDRHLVQEILVEAATHLDVPVEVECRLRRVDGTSRWVLIRALGVAREETGPGLVGSLSDIEQRKALEGTAAARGTVRRRDRPAQPSAVPGTAEQVDRGPSASRGGHGSRCCSWTWTGSRRSTTPWVTWPVTTCCGWSPDGCGRGLRAVDTAARFGGDEFAVLLNDPVPDDLLVVTRRIQEHIAAPVTLGDQEISVTASIGIATADTGYDDAEDVLRDADIAMYRAKETEHGSACLFDPEMHQRALDRLRIRTAVVIALDNHEFVVHYQPIVDLDDTTVSRFEALVRWQHPTRGLLGPGRVPALDGGQLLHRHPRQTGPGRRVRPDRPVAHRGDHPPDVPVNVSVNVSHREFWSPDYLANLRATLERHAVPPQCLSLELTETIIMTDPDEARAVMDDLHALGVSLHIDDFGTGQSSLNLLRTFPVDTLKIDGSFVRELTVVNQTAALVRAIIAMGRHWACPSSPSASRPTNRPHNYAPSAAPPPKDGSTPGRCPPTTPDPSSAPACTRSPSRRAARFITPGSDGRPDATREALLPGDYRHGHQRRSTASDHGHHRTPGRMGLGRSAARQAQASRAANDAGSFAQVD